MKVIMTISDRIHAINFGQTIAEGTPKEVADNPRRDRGLSGRRICLRLTGSTSSTEIFRCSGMSPSRCGRRRSWCWWAPTAPANPRPSRRSPPCSRPRRAASSSTASAWTRLPPYRVIEHGIVHVPEGRRLFPEMSVEENLDHGIPQRRGQGQAVQQTMEWVYELFPRLERQKQLAGTLCGGEQQIGHRRGG